MSIFNSLNKYYNDCFSNDKFDSEKVLNLGLIDRNYDTEVRLKLLNGVYKMVIGAKYMNELALDYVMGARGTYDDVVKKYNFNNPDNKVKELTGRSRIISCQRKTAEIFSEIECRFENKNIDFIEWLFLDKAHMGIEDNEEKLYLRNRFMEQYNEYNDTYYNEVEIDKKDILFKVPSFEKVSEISDEDFEEMMNIIRPYSSHVLAAVQNELNRMDKEMGYLRFLMSKKSKLNEADKERKKVILMWLGKDIIEKEEYIQSSIESDSEIEEENKEKIEESENNIRTISEMGEVFGNISSEEK